MDDSPVDTRGRVLWGLRRYFAVVVVFAIAAPVIAVALGGRGSKGKYRATALVVAQRLALSQAQLPHFGQAVFASGQVADAVASELHTSQPASDLIPGTVSISALPDTVLFEVFGTAKDPGVAAQLANSAATAFVTELNDAGPGVGVFALLNPARRPDHPLSYGVGRTTLAIVGLLAGLLFGVGIVAFIVSIRRPVVSDEDAAVLTSIPVVPVVIRKKAGEAGGMSRLARTVFLTRTELCAVVGVPGAARETANIARRLAGVVGALAVDANGAAYTEGPLILTGSEIDASSDLPPSVLAADARVLVVKEGVSERKLRSAVRQFGPNELDAIAFVAAREGRRRKK